MAHRVGQRERGGTARRARIPPRRLAPLCLPYSAHAHMSHQSHGMLEPEMKVSRRCTTHNTYRCSALSCVGRKRKGTSGQHAATHKGMGRSEVANQASASLETLLHVELS